MVSQLATKFEMLTAVWLPGVLMKSITDEY